MQLGARSITGALLVAAVAVHAGCRNVPTPTQPSATRDGDCLERASFGAPEGSPYCLPFTPGFAAQVIQAYCSTAGWSHRGRFAYDFGCRHGDEIRAARAGVVEAAGDAWPDDDPQSGHENRVLVVHADGSVAFYAHFQRASLAVAAGDSVSAGQFLGRCGSSGTNGPPHLHFEVFERAAYEWERGVPVNFRNAGGPLDARGGLAVGATYVGGACAAGS